MPHTLLEASGGASPNERDHKARAKDLAGGGLQEVDTL